MSEHAGGSAFKAAPPFTSLDAPHPVLDAAGFPKIHAGDQPLGQQAAFAQFYPNGLPVTYNMLHGHDSGGVIQQYTENHLPIRFYTHPPAHAQGKFSAMYGQQRFRKMGELLPERRVHLWNKDEIQSVCNSLRQVFWPDMKRLHKPARWDDLWEFFDAYDLYNYGALNLWNVMNTLFDENKMIGCGWNSDLTLEIGHFADGWVKVPENLTKLKEWNGFGGPVLALLSAADWKEIGNLEDEEISLLKSALLYRRDLLLSGGYQQCYKPPTDLTTACQAGNLVNWLADALVLGDNGLPSPPPSAAVLTSPNGMNATAPCFIQNGCHYYHPLGQNAPDDGKPMQMNERPAHAYGKPAQPTAVEALRKSADAVTTVKTKSGVVIAMGSSKLPPGWEKMQEESAAREAAAQAQVEQPRPVTAAPADSNKHNQHTQVTEAEVEEDQAQVEVDNNVAPVHKGLKGRASSPELRSAIKWPCEESKAQPDVVPTEKVEAPKNGQAHHDKAELTQSEHHQHGKTKNDTIVDVQPHPATGSGPQPA
ncbi:Uncharacterized protein TPAR_02885 [Tolypocladium paradoxum]|uniref:Uncharacterized protein n=1 Tax=Tolypocladium paradoxum TaxID=94208 RepID=A0A2S4L3E9_9HYPO|nr:Uncharacterized protein TPAR_02885 [Tolypocladium paradoxum]